MAVHTKLSKHDISLITKKYNIGNLIKHVAIKEGIENTNYKIITTKNQFILTLYENRVKKKNLPFYLELMLYSKKKGIPCPQPIKDKNGNIINNFYSKKISICSFLNGKSKKKWNSYDCLLIGKNLGYFHRKNKYFKKKLNNDFRQNFWNYIATKLDYNKVDKIIPDSNKFIKEEIKFLKHYWPQTLPNGIIHADLFPDNVFFNNHEITGILDFYFSCNDFFIYDFAITSNAWCFNNGVFKRNFFKNFVNGYELIRPLTNNEKINLNIIFRGASLRFLLTRLYDQKNILGSKLIKSKNPIEFYNILKFHKSLDKGFNYFE